MVIDRRDSNLTPMKKGFMDMMAVIYVITPFILNWRISGTMDWQNSIERNHSQAWLP